MGSRVNPRTDISHRIRQGLSIMGAIILKDFLGEKRSREKTATMLLFSLTVLILFHFAFDLNPQAKQDAAAGILWVIFFFGGNLSLSRIFADDAENGGLIGLRLAPVDRSLILFAKVISLASLLTILAVLVLPIYSVLFNFNVIRWAFVIVVLLGIWGYSIVGVVLAAMLVHIRAKELLMPVLFFPLLLPLMMAVTRASIGIFQGDTLAEVSLWVNLLLVYDVIFSAVAYMVFDDVFDEA